MSFEELKQRQAGMWGTGPYQNITETLVDIHALVIERLDPQPGDRWLDLATGTGAVAELAAKAGAEVTGVDLAPALIETAKERAAEQGLRIDYRVGDCERLELEDGAYDKVSSTCGIMFTPDHAAAAGGPGQMFAMMRPFQPTPPPGVGSPFEWGREEHVHELLGDAFELEIERHVATLRVPSGEDYWQLFSSSYGPTGTAAEALDEARREEFHRTWVDWFESGWRSDGEIAHDREFLLVLGTRR